VQLAEDGTRRPSRPATILIFPGRRRARPPRWWTRLLWRLRHGRARSGRWRPEGVP